MAFELEKNPMPFDAVVLICLCAMVTLGTVFAGSTFQALSLEGNQTIEQQSVSVQQYLVVHSWVYVLALLLLIATVVIVLKISYKAVE